MLNKTIFFMPLVVIFSLIPSVLACSKQEDIQESSRISNINEKILGTWVLTKGREINSNINEEWIEYGVKDTLIINESNFIYKQKNYDPYIGIWTTDGDSAYNFEGVIGPISGYGCLVTSISIDSMIITIGGRDTFHQFFFESHDPVN